MKKRIKFDFDKLHQLFNYDAETGILSYKNGEHVGRKSSLGYLKFRLDGHEVHVHRVAFMMCNGYCPEIIDHINANKLDNKILNLRQASHNENCQNVREPKKSNKTSGLLGVSWHKGMKKFRATITKDAKPIHLGYFNNPYDAHNCYLNAKRQMHKLCTI